MTGMLLVASEHHQSTDQAEQNDHQNLILPVLSYQRCNYEKLENASYRSPTLEVNKNPIVSFLVVGQFLIFPQVVVNLLEGSTPAACSNPTVIRDFISPSDNAVLKIATSSIIADKN